MGSLVALLAATLSMVVTADATSATWVEYPGDNSEYPDFTTVAFGSNTFVATTAAGAERAWTSSDGAVWTPRTAPAQRWSNIAFGNNTFVAVSYGDQKVMTSSDGITWELQTHSSSTSSWQGIAYGDGKFAAVGYGTSAKFSSDLGVTWEAKGGTPGNNQDLAYGNGMWVIVCCCGGDTLSSPTGEVWTSRGNGGKTWRSVVFGNNMFAAVAENGPGMTSPDGITWTLTTAVEYMNGIWFGNGLFVATSHNRMATSTDGISWSMSSFGALYGAAGNGRFVLVASQKAYVLSMTTGAPTTAPTTTGAPTTAPTTPAPTTPAPTAPSDVPKGCDKVCYPRHRGDCVWHRTVCANS